MKALRKVGAIVLSVFGDESSDETKRRVFAVAGVIGSDDLWELLEAKWVSRCDGIPFHAKDCESNKGDFEKFTDKENKTRYRDLTTLLAESGLGGFGIAVDLIGQQRAFPAAPVGMAFYKCFLEVVERMRNCAAYNQETVKFTFDMRPESEYNTGVLYSIARKGEDWSRYLGTDIGFACSRENPRVQVADLFARETMKHLDNEIGPVKRPARKSLVALSNTGRFHIDIYTEEWHADLKSHMGDLEKITGMSMADYAQWLVKTKRMVDNISNRFEYMRFVIERDGA